MKVKRGGAIRSHRQQAIEVMKQEIETQDIRVGIKKNRHLGAYKMYSI